MCDITVWEEEHGASSYKDPDVCFKKVKSFWDNVKNVYNPEIKIMRLSGLSPDILRYIFKEFIRHAHDFKLMESSFGHKHNTDIVFIAHV